METKRERGGDRGKRLRRETGRETKEETGRGERLRKETGRSRETKTGNI